MAYNLERYLRFLIIVIASGIPYHSSFAETEHARSIETQPVYISPASLDGAKTINAEQLIDMANSMPKLTIIDSRTPNDRKMGHIEGSIGLPDFDTTCKSLEELIPDKTLPVLFYCNGINCKRSDNAVIIASECGFINIYWFRGGIEEWNQKSYPLVH